MITTIIIFIVILGVLVFVHEFGHFWVAKKSGMKVDEFGFGFPPRMFGIQKVGGRYKIIWGHKPPLDPEKTVYSINWIPLGGFVKIVGENNDHEDDPRSFINKPFWPRFFTLVAGVTMNVVLAWVIFSIGYGIGLPTAIDSPSNLPKYATLKNPQVAIMEVVKDFPADKAGIMPGDIILQIDGVPFDNLENVRGYIKANEGKVLNFKIKRINNILDLNVSSLANPGENQGPTGIVLSNIGSLSYPWYFAPIEGAKATYYQLSSVTSGFYQLITSKIGLSALGGPVKIARLTGQVANMGFVYIMQFAAFLSLNLAVINILPFPALDGGRVLFLVIEKIRRKKNNQKVEQLVNTVGFVFLILLMVLVTIKDVKNL